MASVSVILSSGLDAKTLRLPRRSHGFALLMAEDTPILNQSTTYRLPEERRHAVHHGHARVPQHRIDEISMGPFPRDTWQRLGFDLGAPLLVDDARSSLEAIALQAMQHAAIRHLDKTLERRHEDFARRRHIGRLEPLEVSSGVVAKFLARLDGASDTARVTIAYFEVDPSSNVASLCEEGLPTGAALTRYETAYRLPRGKLLAVAVIDDSGRTPEEHSVSAAALRSALRPQQRASPASHKPSYHRSTKKATAPQQVTGWRTDTDSVAATSYNVQLLDTAVALPLCSVHMETPELMVDAFNTAWADSAARQLKRDKARKVRKLDRQYARDKQGRAASNDEE